LIADNFMINPYVFPKMQDEKLLQKNYAINTTSTNAITVR